MKKIYVSDNGKQYDTEKACLEADKKFAEAQAAQEREYLEKTRVRKEKADAVQDAYQAYIKVLKESTDKVNQYYSDYKAKQDDFVKEYGCYHTKITTVLDSPWELIKQVFGGVDWLD